MNAVVVYESHWGNTAAVARAIAGDRAGCPSPDDGPGDAGRPGGGRPACRRRPGHRLRVTAGGDPSPAGGRYQGPEARRHLPSAHAELA